MTLDELSEPGTRPQLNSSIAKPGVYSDTNDASELMLGLSCVVELPRVWVHELSTEQIDLLASGMAVTASPPRMDTKAASGVEPRTSKTNMSPVVVQLQPGSLPSSQRQPQPQSFKTTASRAEEKQVCIFGAGERWRMFTVVYSRRLELT